MIVEQIVKIPANRRITLEVPPDIPAGVIARLELHLVPQKDAMNADARQGTTAGRTPISRYFGILSPDTYGDGVVYQRKIRDEWNG